jgi:hypothetical protein
MLPSMRFRASFFLLYGCVALGCGSSVNVDDSTGDDTGGAVDSASGADGTGVDSSTKGDSTPSKDSTSGGDASKDTAAGDDTSVADDSATPDTTPPPTDTSTCPGTTCGSACVDRATDPLDCGSCGTAVCHLEVCRGGAPACAPGYEACGGGGCLGCKDTASDPDNCGGCGSKCDPSTGQLCVDGKCTFSLSGTCPSPLKRCATSTTFGIYGCFNTSTDVGHCGGCDTACSPGQYCRGGKCIDYTSAPGCTSCPCAACAGATPKCCGYAGATVCSAGDCPAP